MKTSAIIVAATAALASAQAPPEGTNKVTCAKPNANYCYGGDIIIRCDANSVGTAGRCSDNVAGYPPLGGVAECYQSSEQAGDAACQKNCVVYAQPSFTLAADQCSPSFTASATGYPTPPNTLETSVVGSSTAAYPPPADSSSAAYPPPAGSTTAAYPPPAGSTTAAYPPPAGSSSAAYPPPAGSSSAAYPPPAGSSTVAYPPPAGSSSAAYPPPAGSSSVVYTTPGSSITYVLPPVTPTLSTPAGTGVPPPPPAGGNQTAPTGTSGTNTPVGPTSSGPSTIPTNAAVANRAGGALAVMGLVAAYFL